MLLLFSKYEKLDTINVSFNSFLPKFDIVNLLSGGIYKMSYHDLGNDKGGSIIVPLTSCLTGLESAV